MEGGGGYGFAAPLSNAHPRLTGTLLFRPLHRRWAVRKVLPRRRGQKKHHPAMPYGELPAFLQMLRASTADTITKLGLEFLILTAARTGEVHFMEWGEVDTEAATWTVPAARMKARREHRVPLSRRGLAILEEARSLGTGTGLVFPSRKGKPLSNMAFTMILRRLDAGDAVPHGFRSTFKDWTHGTDHLLVGRGGNGAGAHPGIVHRVGLRPL